MAERKARAGNYYYAPLYMLVDVEGHDEILSFVGSPHPGGLVVKVFKLETGKNWETVDNPGRFGDSISQEWVNQYLEYERNGGEL